MIEDSPEPSRSSRARAVTRAGMTTTHSRSPVASRNSSQLVVGSLSVAASAGGRWRRAMAIRGGSLSE